MSEADGLDFESEGRREWRKAADYFDAKPNVKFWGALKRAHQDFYVNVTARAVDRQLASLVDAYRQLARGDVRGSLELAPDIEMPAYLSTVDIHCVPGGYGLERCDDDVYPGARSDLGGAVFAMRRHGALHDDKGVTGARVVKERFPAFSPKAILDLGCTSGNSTLPYVDAFPDAQVYAIDVAAPCLRYAHGRAESLGKPVHFSQQNAEHTRFESGKFDLIVSHILLHEISVAALANIFREAYRLLAPGGVMAHVEVPTMGDNAFSQYLNNWDALHNNEPFWATLGEADLPDFATEAGFAAEDVFSAVVPSSNKKRGGWLVFGARKQGA
ncbi:MAG: class I SAM-dependent methyltransferase [Parvularculaceae bacterium]